MRRLLTIALVVLGLAVPTATAHASSGWMRHHDHYVRWSSQVSLPTDRDPTTPELTRFLDARSAAIRRAVHANDRFAARQAAAIRRAAAEAAATAPAPAPATVEVRPVVTYQGSVPSLIASVFAPLGQSSVDRALCTANRESRLDPSQRNASSGAAGLFQLMPFWWNGGSSYGWVFDPYDAYENAHHAFLIVSASGWGAWNGGCV